MPQRNSHCSIVDNSDLFLGIKKLLLPPQRRSFLVHKTGSIHVASCIRKECRSIQKQRLEKIHSVQGISRLVVSPGVTVFHQHGGGEKNLIKQIVGFFLDHGTDLLVLRIAEVYGIVTSMESLFPFEH